jgi:putative addiction module killer protein
VRQTETFRRWHRALRDRRAAARITNRIERMADGNFGDVEPAGGGLSELRIDYGPGYRVYFTRRGETLCVLLCGGDKSTQTRDIKAARRLAEGLSDA